jgi:predicted Zn-dependent protease
MVADLKGQLVRWPDRREQGLRIWVQSNSTVHDWNLRYAQMARDAFDDWGSVGLPLRFDFILDSTSADIRIVWGEQFAAEQGERVANTLRTSNQTGWLTSAQILVAIHDSTGRAIPPDALVGIVRHEAGHALGLGHSNDPRTEMFPVQHVSDITPADRATLKLLYEFPPGIVR